MITIETQNLKFSINSSIPRKKKSHMHWLFGETVDKLVKKCVVVFWESDCHRFNTLEHKICPGRVNFSTQYWYLWGMFSAVDVQLKCVGGQKYSRNVEPQITLIREVNTFLTLFLFLSRPHQFDQRNLSDVVTDTLLGSHYQKISISHFQRLEICKLTLRQENR